MLYACHHISGTTHLCKNHSWGRTDFSKSEYIPWFILPINVGSSLLATMVEISYILCSHHFSLTIFETLAKEFYTQAPKPSFITADTF